MPRGFSLFLRSLELRGPRKYRELFIFRVVLEKPSLFLELCELIYEHSGIEVSEATVWTDSKMSQVVGKRNPDICDCSNGLVACECTTGSQKFFDFVRGSLIPHMHILHQSPLCFRQLQHS